MKQCFLLIAILYCGWCTTGAQQSIVKMPDKYLQATIKNHSQAGVSSGQRTTTISSRLIASSEHYFDGTVYAAYDSEHLYYSDMRGGGTYDQQYDSALDFVIGPGGYMPQYRYVQTYDANNNMLTEEGFAWDVTKYLQYNQQLYTYNADNTKATYIDQDWDSVANKWTNTLKVLYSHNSAHYITLEVDQTWDGSKWNNSYQYIYTYDATGKIQTKTVTQSWNKSTKAWDNYSQSLLTYDASNNVISEVYQMWIGGKWVNSSEYLYTYDSLNDYLTEIENKWNTSTNKWDHSEMYVNTYDASGYQLSRTYKTWISWINNWRNNGSDLYGYDSKHNFLADTTQNWDTVSSKFVNVSRFVYAYNSFDEMVSAIGDTWNVGGFWKPVPSNEAYYYYYETYATAVENVSTTIDNVIVYPVPAQNTLNVSIKWNQAQPFTIGVYDVQGRLIKQTNGPAAQSSLIIIPVPEIPSGNYFVTIKGDNAQITKQVVIAH